MAVCMDCGNRFDPAIEGFEKFMVEENHIEALCGPCTAPGWWDFDVDPGPDFPSRHLPENRGVIEFEGMVEYGPFVWETDEYWAPSSAPTHVLCWGCDVPHPIEEDCDGMCQACSDALEAQHLRNYPGPGADLPMTPDMREFMMLLTNDPVLTAEWVKENSQGETR